MTETHEKLEVLEQELAARGADGVRLALVRRARNFKRSWVEMAEALVMVQNKHLHQEWGYQDFHQYCQTELMLTRATVDKLTGRFQLVAEHAPQVLQRDGVAQPIPSMGAVDYFAKALRGSNDDENYIEPAPDEAWDELKQAVFEDNQSVAVLRKEFDQVFFNKAEGAQNIENLEKLRTAMRRVEGLMVKVEGLDEDKCEALMAAISAMRDELDQRIPDAKDAMRRAS